MKLKSAQLDEVHGHFLLVLEEIDRPWARSVRAVANRTYASIAHCFFFNSTTESDHARPGGATMTVLEAAQHYVHIHLGPAGWRSRRGSK